MIIGQCQIEGARAWPTHQVAGPELFYVLNWKMINSEILDERAFGLSGSQWNNERNQCRNILCYSSSAYEICVCEPKHSTTKSNISIGFLMFATIVQFISK